MFAATAATASKYVMLHQVSVCLAGAGLAIVIVGSAERACAIDNDSLKRHACITRRAGAAREKKNETRLYISFSHLPPQPFGFIRSRCLLHVSLMGSR